MPCGTGLWGTLAFMVLSVFTTLIILWRRYLNGKPQKDSLEPIWSCHVLMVLLTVINSWIKDSLCFGLRGITLRFTPFSVVNSLVYSVYTVKCIYFLYMHIFITIFALTWTKGFIFFHYGCYYHGGLLPHLFCMTYSKLVCPFRLIPKLVLRSQHCTFVILTSQLWNKQERLQVLVVLASWGVHFLLLPTRRSCWRSPSRSRLDSLIRKWSGSQAGSPPTTVCVYWKWLLCE